MLGDDDVVACFCDSVAQDGFMRRYIRAGQLAVVIDCNVFVHGGLFNHDGVSLVDFYPVGIPSVRDVVVRDDPEHLIQWLTGMLPRPNRQTLQLITTTRQASTSGSNLLPKPTLTTRRSATGARRSSACTHFSLHFESFLSPLEQVWKRLRNSHAWTHARQDMQVMPKEHNRICFCFQGRDTDQVTIAARSCLQAMQRLG